MNLNKYWEIKKNIKIDNESDDCKNVENWAFINDKWSFLKFMENSLVWGWETFGC